MISRAAETWPEEKEKRMKVTYIGETKEVKTVSGKDVKLTKGMELECMEREYHSATAIRAVLSSGEHVKVKRNELKKIDVC
jgi:hypothetical protein